MSSIEDLENGHNILKGFLIKFMKSNKIVYLSIFLSFLSLFLQIIVSSIIYRKFMNKQELENKFGNLMKKLCLLWLSIFTIYYIKAKIDSIISPAFSKQFRKDLYENYLFTNEYNFDDKNSEKDNLKLMELGTLTQRLFTWIIDYLIPIFIIIIFMNIYFFIKSPIIGLINFLSNIINILIIKKYYSKIIKFISYRKKDHEKTCLNMSENMNNLINIYTSGELDNTINKTENLLLKYQESYKKEVNIIGNFVNTLRLNVYSSIFLSIIMLYKYSEYSNKFLEIFSIFVLYIPAFQTVTSEIPSKIAFYTDIVITLQKLYNKKKLSVDKNGYLVKPSYFYKYNKDNIEKCKGSLLIDNITFSYAENKNIFENFKLDIKPKERIAIKGRSGRGKTTLSKLLLNFIKPQKGNIILDGVNINDIDVKELRYRINYINQRTNLLGDTIINNLKYGNDKKEEEIVDFIKKYEFDKILPNLNQVIDMNGKNISMGMQKLIYLIRNILKDECCVYIFDEPLTSLDYNSRKNVIKMIDEKTKDKTVIIITHDEEILDIVDKKIDI
jgi:ABC-type multidrug transport system fused ATPase/permease subunit